VLTALGIEDEERWFLSTSRELESRRGLNRLGH
jgi:hypothetical protein